MLDLATKSKALDKSTGNGQIMMVMNGYKFDANATEPSKVAYEKSYSG